MIEESAQYKWVSSTHFQKESKQEVKIVVFLVKNDAKSTKCILNTLGADSEATN